MTTLADRLEALDASAARLASMTNGLSPEQLDSQSYPKKWSVSDVLSHLGSGAVIMRRGLAKSPAARATDVVAADRALLDRLAELTDDERATAKFSLGPFELDLTTFVGLRLNEHVLHTWDIEVVLDPSATLPSDTGDVVIDNLGMIIGWAGKSDGNERDIAFNTTAPARSLVLKVGAERMSLEPAADATAAGAIEMPSEALVRLVYGRLDPDHTPAGVGGPDVDQLRQMFPGF